MYIRVHIEWRSTHLTLQAACSLKFTDTIHNIHRLTEIFKFSSGFS